jgi:phosphoglucomutase
MTTEINPLAGKPAPLSSLIDVAKLVTAYFDVRPNPAIAAQRVVFGTSGHRGSPFDASFNEWHVLAITQAICDYLRPTITWRSRSTTCSGIDPNGQPGPPLARRW